MCTWAAAGMVGLQAMGIRQQNYANASLAEAQARGSIKEMNYAFQNYEQERQDAYDAAVNDIIKTRINQMQLNSQVEAAIAEGMSGGGRMANRLLRATAADTARTIDSIQDNYLRKSNEVDLNKESTALSTKDYIQNLKAQSKPNKWGDILSLAGTALQGYNDYRTEKTRRQLQGGDFGFNGSYTKKATGKLTIKTQEYKQADNFTKYGWYND